MCILGVGPKPVTVLDTKAKSKNGGKGGPQPGDVGFFKLGLLSTPQNHNDGSKVISVKYDYCSFNSGEFLCISNLYYKIFLFRLGSKERVVYWYDATSIQVGWFTFIKVSD